MLLLAPPTAPQCQPATVNSAGEWTASRPIYLIYMLDLTSSMGSWIAEAKRKFTTIVAKLRPMYAHIPGGIRVGFVGYRDYDDYQRFLVAAPSTDHAAVLRTLAAVRVAGGIR